MSVFDITLLLCFFAIGYSWIDVDIVYSLSLYDCIILQKPHGRGQVYSEGNN